MEQINERTRRIAPAIARGSLTALAVLAAVFVTTPAPATVLTFGGTGFLGNNGVVYYPTTTYGLPVYGDHVSSGSVTAGGGTFLYGNNGEGFTPHIGIAYGPGVQSAVTATNNPTPVYYPSGFGNLGPVIYQVDTASGSGNPAVYVPNLTLSVTLTADPGWRAQLRGFDLAAWNGFPNNLDLLEVIVDGVTNVVGSNIAVANTSSTRTSYLFPTPYTGAQVQIFLDGRDTSPYGGSPSLAFNNFTDIGLSNILLTEAVPEPSTMLLLGVGGVWCWRKRRTK